MQTRRTPRSIPSPGEEGYILIAVIFLMVMMLIALSVAAPKIAADIQRDREVELMHRGKQYQRAIQLYYRKFGKYPPTLEALDKTNNIRFLRKRYKDPETGKDEWHLIHFGEAKTQTLGFFGQPIAGTGGAGSSLLVGVGPSGGNTAGGLFGGNPTDPNAVAQTAAQANATPTPDPNAQNPANPGSPTDPTAPANGAAGSTAGVTSSSPFGSSSSQQTFGGGGIIGVESTSARQSILEYKKKKHFNEWEFVYDPLSERLGMAGGMGGSGLNGNGTSTGIGGANGGIGGANGGVGGIGGANGGIGGANGGIGGSPAPTPPIGTSPNQ